MACFLNLPSELRNAIYEVTFTYDSPIEIRHRHAFEIGQTTQRAFTQVSRQIRAECLPFYYSSNIFHLSSLKDSLSWLRAVGPASQYLRHLRLADGVMENRSWATTMNQRHHPRAVMTFQLYKSERSEAGLIEMTAEADVVGDMSIAAQTVVQSIADHMGHIDSYDLQVYGSAGNCAHCRSSECRLCRRGKCCKANWEDEDE